MENFGYTREYLLKCINNRELNYATAAYYLYFNSIIEQIWNNRKKLDTRWFLFINAI